MWIAIQQLSAFQSAHLHSIGRALGLAQNFESGVKEMLRWSDIVKLTEDGEASLAQILERPDLLRDLMLRASARRLETVHRLPTPEQVELLSAAIDARNFVAHQCALRALYPPKSDSALREQMEEYERTVRALALGDNVASTWLYEFHEREGAPARQVNLYPEAVARWVLEPFPVDHEGR